ncbi:hypothetical protein QOT17_004263 [Balamuthia mandrillaris]
MNLAPAAAQEDSQTTWYYVEPFATLLLSGVAWPSALICTRAHAERLMASVGSTGLTKGLLATFARLPGDVRDSYLIWWRHRRAFSLAKAFGGAVLYSTASWVLTSQVRSAFQLAFRVPSKAASPLHPLRLLSYSLGGTVAGLFLHPVSVLWSTSFVMPLLPLPPPSSSQQEGGGSKSTSAGSWAEFFVGMFTNRNGFWLGLPATMYLSNLEQLDTYLSSYLAKWMRREVWQMPFASELKGREDQEGYFGAFDDGLWTEEQVERSKRLSAQLQFYIGQTAVVLAATGLQCLLSSPMEVILARLEHRAAHYVDLADGPSGLGQVLYGGVVATAKKIMEEEGVWGFYKGFAINFMTNALLKLQDAFSDDGEEEEEEEPLEGDASSLYRN